jgi:hypothetical protein
MLTSRGLTAMSDLPNTLCILLWAMPVGKESP